MTFTLDQLSRLERPIIEYTLRHPPDAWLDVTTIRDVLVNTMHHSYDIKTIMHICLRLVSLGVLEAQKPDRTTFRLPKHLRDKFFQELAVKSP